jgi:hypothetical protein
LEETAVAQAAQSAILGSSAPSMGILDRLFRVPIGRRTVFAYDVLAILALLVVGTIFWEAPGIRGSLIPAELQLPFYAMWFGALGGVTISFKGVYDNAGAPERTEQSGTLGIWNAQYNLWHFGRPLSGAITGLMTWVLLRALNPTAPNLPAPIIASAAFLLGTQERRFFAFLFEVSRIIVQVPEKPGAAGIRIDQVEPKIGAAGEVLLLRGQGFLPDAQVLLGGKVLSNVQVSDDGTAIAGGIPDGSGQADVIVANPDGSAYSLSHAFTYREPAQAK